MGQIILAAIAAFILLGIFGSTSDGTIKKAAGKILLTIAVGLGIVPIVLWCFTTFSPFVVTVLILFVVFRWLLGSSGHRIS